MVPDYSYLQDLLSLESCQAPHIPALPAAAREVTTPLRAEAWEVALRGHPDRAFVGFILQGITQGFRIGFDGSKGQAKSAARNMASALANPGPVDAYLETELTANCIALVSEEEGRGW